MIHLYHDIIPFPGKLWGSWLHLPTTSTFSLPVSSTLPLPPQTSCDDFTYFSFLSQALCSLWFHHLRLWIYRATGSVLKLISSLPGRTSEERDLAICCFNSISSYLTLGTVADGQIYSKHSHISFFLLVVGIELRALQILGKSFNIGLHPQPHANIS